MPCLLRMKVNVNVRVMLTKLIEVHVQFEDQQTGLRKKAKDPIARSSR